MKRRLLSPLTRGLAFFSSRMTLRNSCLALAALAAIALPFVLLPSGQAQRTKLVQDQSSAPKTSSPPVYRSAGDRHKLQVSDDATAKKIESQGARLIADYSSFKIYEANSNLADSLAADKEVQVRDEDNVVQLNSGPIDTTDQGAQALRRPTGSFSGKRMHLVQFAGPIKSEWFKALQKTGAEVVTYVPSNAYLVYGDAGQLRRVQTLADSSSSVQWHGEYKNVYRLDPSIPNPSLRLSASKANKAAAVKPDADGLFSIQLVKDEAANAETLSVIEKLSLEPIKSQYEIMNYVNIVVRLNSSTVVNELSLRDDVVSIQPRAMPKKLDERQDQIIAGNLAGSAPVPGNYLTYLIAHGFDVTTTASFGVNMSDSGIDNATTTPNHFALYRVGDPTVPGNSRVIYNRLEGTPNPGSTLQGCDGHGNLNSHIVGAYVPTGGIFGAFPHADASGFRYDLGVAPFVKLGSSVIFDPNTFTNPNVRNLESKAYNDGMRISSNSWGSTSNSYSVDSQAYDSLVRDAQQTGSTFPAAGNQEYVIVFAAGNGGSGANTVGEPSTGKNVITVGASENVQAFGGADQCGVADTGADSANDLIGFSSRGPTSDGRKKPDIVAPGTHVSGGVGQASLVSPTGSGTGNMLACFTAGGVCGGPSGSPNFFPAGQQWYTASSGTSHSTPAIAGYAALMRQFFINNGLTPPTPALTKALMLNTARYLNGTGANDTLPSNNQGMGEANFNAFFDVFASAHILRDEVPAEKFTASGQQRVITGFVPDNSKPFRVTLAWTDAPGPTSGNAFVNNLDLEVVVGGNTYKGNVFSGATSVPGGAADIRNNVESVFIPAGVTGTFVIKIKGTNIAGNGVPGDADPLDQDYSLVAFNATEAPLPVMTSGSKVITAESCSPGNGAIDPGETVTVNFGLSNIGTANTTDLVATLLSTGGVSSPSGPQDYGVVTAGGPEVTRPFTFTASLSCGQTLTATLHLQDGATDLGNVTFTFLIGTLSAPVLNTYSTGNIAVPIPDVNTVEIPINVPDAGAVADINVRVRLNHTFDGDLVISLISPDGTTVVLSQNRGGSGANYGSGALDCSGTHTVFDDSAPTAISAGTAPFAGSFRPESPLSAFNGVLTSGTWKLRVTDTAALDTGTVGCVQLEINRQQFVCCGVSGTPTLVADGSSLVNESCPPNNALVDPGERVTLNLKVANNGTGATSNLVATLQPSANVIAPSGPQNYGVIAPSTSVGRDFSFTADGSCGTNITLNLQLQDGLIDLGTVSYTVALGTVVSSSQTFSNPGAITIPASGTGTSTGSPASPYPSSITVAGAPTQISKVTVTLTNFNHTFPDDVDLLLVSPTGRKMIILSDAGSLTVATNLNITLDDDAATQPPDGTGITSGTFKPANYGTIQDPFPAPAPAGPYLSAAPGGADTLTSAFTGVAGGNPNGTWSLYVVDDAAGDVGNFNGGWSLTLTQLIPTCTTPCGGVRLGITSTLTRVDATHVSSTVTVQNIGNATANNVILNNARLGSTSGTPLPQSLGNIAAGASVSTTVTFVNSTAGASSTLTIGGTYDGGTFSSSRRVTIP